MIIVWFWDNFLSCNHGYSHINHYVMAINVLFYIITLHYVLFELPDIASSYSMTRSQVWYTHMHTHLHFPSFSLLFLSIHAPRKEKKKKIVWNIQGVITPVFIYRMNSDRLNITAASIKYQHVTPVEMLLSNPFVYFSEILLALSWLSFSCAATLLLIPVDLEGRKENTPLKHSVCMYSLRKIWAGCAQDLKYDVA